MNPTINTEHNTIIQIKKTGVNLLEKSLSSHSSSSWTPPWTSSIVILMRASTMLFAGPMSFDFKTWILASLRCFITSSASTDPPILRVSTSGFSVLTVSVVTCLQGVGATEEDDSVEVRSETSTDSEDCGSAGWTEAREFWKIETMEHSYLTGN